MFTRVPEFLPSQSGFHFLNNYPQGTPYPVVNLPVIGPLNLGDAGNGLCGGFVMATLDLFRHNPRFSPPANTDRPAPGSPMFNYLTDRLMTSFGELPQVPLGNAFKVIEWIRTPGHNVDISFYGAGLGQRMVEQEWPKVKADIDSGAPSPLNLIAGPERGWPDVTGTIDTLHHCHQVLAYGYELDSAKNLKLLVYDCNDPTNDNSTISLNISNPAHTITIAAPAVAAALGAGVTIRAFFRSDYLLHDPSVIAGKPVAGNQVPANPWQEIGHANNVVAMTATSSKLFCATRDNKLWARDPVSSDVNWQEIGHANYVVGMAAIGNKLFCATSDNRLWVRDAILSDVPWQEIGHANYVVGMAATPSKLFAATRDNKLWARAPVPGVNWQEIGQANNVVAMAATPSKLFCATSDNRLWSRDPVTNNVNWKELDHAYNVVGLAASGDKLFSATRENKLWVRAAS